jgi:single-stranded-DNA-specific exonuclease
MISPSALRFRRACPQTVKDLRTQVPHLSRVVAEMLVARGHTTPEQVERFFHPSVQALHSPSLFKDMDKAATLLKDALADGKRVLIHGDYDCDGICATTLLMEALQEIGADVDYHIPDRFREGYGLSAKAVDRCVEEGFGVLITVDCGSSSVAEVQQAREAGVLTIVTDHHTVPSEAPQPDAFVNPQQSDCSYPFKGICGTGVAFKLVQALRGQSGATPEHFLDLVALATVADVVPLVDENRVLVQLGLQQLGHSRREGLTALLEVAGRTGRDVVDSFTVGFTLGPRLNAAGRLEHAKVGVELLTSRSLTESRKLATHLDTLNEQRKECERAIQEEVEIRLQSEPQRYRRGAIVEWGEGWHEGVIGITAGRLAEKYGVPTLIIATDGKKAKGSGRSPENVDLYQALKQCGALFTKYGGHPRAGGFSLKADKLEALSDAFEDASNGLRDGPAPVWVDGCLSLADADLGLVSELEGMEPFGEGNPKPTFLLEGLNIVNRRLVGRDGDHLQLELEGSGQRKRAIAFRQADLVDELRPQEYRYDVRCQLGRDQFRGNDQLKVQVSGIVRPVCQDQEDKRAPLIDMRHLRARRKALTHWLAEDPDLVVLCRDPGKAETTLPEFAGRFHSYQSCPPAVSGLLLVAPPSSVEQFSDLLNERRPGRLVLLFGAQEIDREYQHHLACRWDRQAAISVWQYLRRSKNEKICFPTFQLSAEKSLRLPPEVVAEIIEAFVETEALVRLDDQKLAFAQANGKKLEETRAFQEQGLKAERLRELREFFSGPDVLERMSVRWTWLGSTTVSV